MISAIALLLLAAQEPPAPQAATGADVVVTPDKGNAGDSLGRAATRPLRDLNLMRPKIAPDLAEIMANPYDIRALRTCRALNTEANRMTMLVGPDVDDPALADAKGRTPAEKVLDTAEGITGSLIPGQGIIRELTGANRAARHAAAARLAGQLRRSYIKGAMKARGCKLVPPPPAPAK
ncbi:hypothetical protein [Sandarakinorhabdus oryzae]|uniref:hypothetical protein n=1 Tax=Sandarakinorhabdus oryzae TaxID=2675220 RepID=UPI0012E1AC38|nr:hypothetical protein [Sandarakinorhabdus oryzae]